MPKTDYAHKLTDKELAILEKRISSIYYQVAKEIDDKVKAYFEQFKKRDEDQKKKLDAGKITNQEYKQWRLAQIGRGKRFEDLRDKLAERMTKANEVAASYINDTTPGIYSLNRNYAAYTIEQVAGDVGFTLWDEQTVKRLIVESPDLMPYYPPERAVKRGIDLAYGKRQITNQVMSSILMGESISHLADRLQKNIPDMNRTSAVRAARTAVTGAQNAGRIDSYTAAEKMGIKLKKKWLATLDNRTRHSHAALDGVAIDNDEKFSNGCMFPGDPNGSPAEVYNCRCTLIASLPDVDTSDAKRRAKDPITGESVLIEDMSFSEWAGWKKATPIYGSAADIEAAISQANQIGVKYARFEKMTLERANNIVEAVATLPEDCVPKAVANGKETSLLTGRPLGRKADQWYGVTYDYRTFSLATMQLGYDKTDYDGGIIVGINTTKFKTLEQLTKAKIAEQEKYFNKTGRYWFFNTDGKATAFHEMGHCYADVRGLPSDWDKLAERWAEESKCDMLKSPDEAFAEAWGAYHSKTRELPDYISDVIKEMK